MLGEKMTRDERISQIRDRFHVIFTRLYTSKDDAEKRAKERFDRAKQQYDDALRDIRNEFQKDCDVTTTRMEESIKTLDGGSDVLF